MKSGKLIKSITFANGLTLQSTIGQPFFVSIHYGFFTVHDQGFIFDKSKCKSINLQTNCFPMQIGDIEFKDRPIEFNIAQVIFINYA